MQPKSSLHMVATMECAVDESHKCLSAMGSCLVSSQSVSPLLELLHLGCLLKGDSECVSVNGSSSRWPSRCPSGAVWSISPSVRTPSPGSIPLFIMFSRGLKLFPWEKLEHLNPWMFAQKCLQRLMF